MLRLSAIAIPSLVPRLSEREVNICEDWREENPERVMVSVEEWIDEYALRVGLSEFGRKSTRNVVQQTLLPLLWYAAEAHYSPIAVARMVRDGLKTLGFGCVLQ